MVSHVVVSYNKNHEGDEYQEKVAFLQCHKYNSRTFYQIKETFTNEQEVFVEQGPTISLYKSPKQIISGPMDSAWPMFCHDSHHSGQSPARDSRAR